MTFDSNSISGFGYLDNNPYDLQNAIGNVGQENSIDSSSAETAGLSLPGGKGISAAAMPTQATIASEETLDQGVTASPSSNGGNGFLSNFINNLSSEFSSGQGAGINVDGKNYTTSGALAGAESELMGGSTSQNAAAAATANSGAASTGYFTDILLRGVVIVLGFIFVAIGLSMLADKHTSIQILDTGGKKVAKDAAFVE